MKEKELRKLNRAELLTMLMSLTQKCEDLENELQKAKEELADRQVKIQECGTLAEAMVQINGLMEAADRAAKEYLDNLRRRGGDSLPESAPAGNSPAAAAENAAENAPAPAEPLKKEEAERLEHLAAIEHETKKRCDEMVEKAKAEAQAYWDEAYARLREYCEQTESLKDMLGKLPGTEK